MTNILTHMYRVRAILALLFLSSASLWAQSDDATLINITTLAQLDAIHYDLNGDGMVDASASMADSISYETAFGLARKGSITCTGGCSGYELRNDLDFEDADGDGTADDKSIWAEGAGAAGVPDAVAEGWAAIGYYNSRSDNAYYTATFDGGGYTISNLYVNRSTSYVGLFGLLGAGSNVRNLGIEGGSVTGGSSVGGLAGANVGTISACYTTGDATGTSNNVGGLVGQNEGTISACYAMGNTSGSSSVGGLVGVNVGTIRACYATGDASGFSSVGGLVGYNDDSGTISACYATGNATGTGDYVGGFVGRNSGGSISACYATGDATGTSDYVGGFVGRNQATTSACYATGNATGASYIGGLAGRNGGATISACYATGDASGASDVGGLVGNNFAGTVTNSYFDSTVSNRTDSDPYDKTTTDLQTPTAYGTAMEIYANWNVDVDDGQPIGVDDGTAAGDSDTDDPWDFGTDSEYPALKVDFDRSGTPSVAEFGMQPRTASLRVSSFTPERGVVDATVTITGTGFSTTATDNTVTFLGAAADADNAAAMVSTSPAPSTIELTVTVPSGAMTGKISVMVGTAADTSSQDFTVLIGEDKDENDNGLIEVSSLEQLHAIRYDLNGDGMVDASASMADSISYETAFGLARKGSITCTGGCSGYELRNDLDFKNGSTDPTMYSIWAEGSTATGAVSEGWVPIGDNSTDSDATRFTATFDGRGRTISNLYINRNAQYSGLFGYLGTGSNLRNLGIEGGTVTSTYATDFPSAGGLVGQNNGTITTCYSTGAVTVGSGDRASAGGLVGDNGGTITACYSTGAVTGGTGTFSYTGGLVGYHDTETITACYATGAVTGGTSDRARTGGLVGHNDKTISACYATGNTTGAGIDVGGLVGHPTRRSTVTNSYFDSETSGIATGTGAKTTAELQTPTAYAGIYSNWNIDVDDGQPIGVDDGTAAGDSDTDNPWDFGTSSEYPVLKVDFNANGTPTAFEFGGQGRAASLRVSSFTPERGVVDATVTITGTGFSTTATDNTVTFLGAEGDADNAEATVSAATAFSLTVTVPPAAQTGPISVMVGAVADTSSQDFTVLIGEDKDENDNGLIEVSSLEQLHAIRYDLDGDGVPSGTDPQQAAYRTAFGLSGAGAASCTGGCVGYELMSDLDFNDIDATMMGRSALDLVGELRRRRMSDRNCSERK